MYDQNYSCYPFKVMYITQGYNGETSHKKHQYVTPKDFPFDERGEDSGRNYMYCPCDEMEVVKVFNSTKTGQTNTFWFRSTSPVVTPTFTDYIVIMVSHPNDDMVNQLWVGKRFKRWEPMLLEGMDGATAYHFHNSVARGQTAGWQLCKYNGTEFMVQTGDTKKPEECFFIDYSFSKMVNSQWIDFMPLDRYIAEHQSVITPQPTEEPKPIEQPKEPIIETPLEPQNKPVGEQMVEAVQTPSEEQNIQPEPQNETTEPIKEADKPSKWEWLDIFIKNLIDSILKTLKGGK